MDTAQMARLCTVFRLGEPISKLQAVQGGMLHRLWRLHTTHGVFALKQLNPVIMRKAGIRDEYRLTERIAESMTVRGVPAAVALKGEGDGGTVQEIGDATCIVYDWVEGETLSTQAVEPERTRLIGTILARMHSLQQQEFPELELPDREPFSEDEWDMLTFQSSDRDIPWTQQVRKALPLLIEWSKLATDASKMLRRTSVVSHRDLDQKNVLWRDAVSPVVIDWEAAGLTNPTMDVVGAALSWSGQNVQPPREESFHALLEGYVTAGGIIHDPGIIALHGVIGTWLGWLLFNMHRSLGESVNSEEERQVGVRETTRTLSTLRALAANAEMWAKWVDKWV
ncbi:MAG: aminoglycoside phosphotransferase family protein [Ktedonobacteraceae bacterium]